MFIICKKIIYDGEINFEQNKYNNFFFFFRKK